MPKTKSLNFRVNEIDWNKLERLSKLDGSTSIGPFCAKILHKYIQFYVYAEKNRQIVTPRRLLHEVYDNIDEKNINKIVKTHTEEIHNYFRIKIGKKFTPNKIREEFRDLLEANAFNIMLEEIQEKNDTFNEFVCTHNMGKNWSYVMMKTFCNLLEGVGCTIICKEHSENHFIVDSKP